ncbi:MAG: hypothetical protein ACI4ET_10330, partial [Bilifractor sp.]
KSIALTHRSSGSKPLNTFYISRRSRTYKIKSTEYDNWSPIHYDGKYLYEMKLLDDGKNCEIRKEYFPRYKFKVNDSTAADYAAAEVVTSFSTELYHVTITNGYSSTEDYYDEETGYCYAQYRDQYFDGNDGYIYVIGSYTRRDPNHQHQICYFTINYGDGSWKKSDTIWISISPSWSFVAETAYLSDFQWGNTSAKTDKLGYGHDSSYYYMDSNSLALSKGYIYLKSNDAKGIIIIPIAEPLKQNKITIYDKNSSNLVHSFHEQSHSYNGHLHFCVHEYGDNNKEFYKPAILYPDGVYIIADVAINTNNWNWPYYSWDTRNYGGFILSDKLSAFSCVSPSYQAQYGFEANYLGTINNLSSPITKTASQTMKVIYTLTDVDDEESSDT